MDKMWSWASAKLVIETLRQLDGHQQIISIYTALNFAAQQFKCCLKCIRAAW